VRPGNFVSLPIRCRHDGNISVPYAGALKAAGRTPGEIQADIVKAIGNRAIEPQAIVALITTKHLADQRAGRGHTPSRLQANAAGERVLDAITRAGGHQGSGYEILGDARGVTASVRRYRFGALMYQPATMCGFIPAIHLRVSRTPGIFGLRRIRTAGTSSLRMWRILPGTGMGIAGGLLDVQARTGRRLMSIAASRENW